MPRIELAGHLSSLERHCHALAECHMCGHAAEVRPIRSNAAAPTIILVGQAPGRAESTGGMPFAGRAGRTLFRWLERAGIDEETARRGIYIAAVTRCYPGPHPGGRGDRVPSLEEQEACSTWLTAELKLIRPSLVIPVGQLAIGRFLARVPLAQLIGRSHSITHAGGQSVAIPLPHPSGASSWIHQPGHARLLESALDLLAVELRHLRQHGEPARQSVA